MTDNLLNKNLLSIEKKIYMIIQENNTINVNKFLKYINDKGILNNDPRIINIIKEIINLENFNYEKLKELINKNILIFKKIFENNLIIPDFPKFTNKIKEIYNNTKDLEGGSVADYIPQLARVDPDQYGVSICTIDGQRYSIGDTKIDFSVQSCCKPINYGIVLEDIGTDIVHKYVGREPSGQAFNELLLNKEGKPHNPLINSGAIMISSLIKNQESPAERFEYVNKIWNNLAGNIYKIGFNNSVYLSEKKTADRNFALAYFMKEINKKKKQGFPSGTDINETLELYFQCCSIEVNCEILSIVASTLANNGINPLTNKRIWNSKTVRNILSMMMTCGMYDYSGEFAFKIGIPAKSGVAGAIMIVIPNVMGICTWSPKLDKIGNSFKGIEFYKLFGEKFNFHIFDNSDTKMNILKNNYNSLKQYEFYELTLSASRGDIEHMKHLYMKNIDMNQSDYDGRTPLHLAVCEQQQEIVEFLINIANVILKKDRWNRTPYDDAIKTKNNIIIKIIKNNYNINDNNTINDIINNTINNVIDNVISDSNTIKDSYTINHHDVISDNKK